MLKTRIKKENNEEAEDLQWMKGLFGKNHVPKKPTPPKEPIKITKSFPRKAVGAEYTFKKVTPELPKEIVPEKILEKVIEKSVDGTFMEEINGKFTNLTEIVEKLKREGTYEYGSSLNLLVNGAGVGITNNLDIKNGSNTTVSYSIDNLGVVHVQVNATGSGLSRITLTGTVSQTSPNNVFTSTTLPTWVIVDGAWLEQKDANGGTNWSHTGSLGAYTITTTSYPQNSIWGF